MNKTITSYINQYQAYLEGKEDYYENNRNLLKFMQINKNADNLKGNSTQKENLPDMKYKNITIKKHKTKDLWYCRIRINGKQIYISSKNQNECLNKLKQTIKEREKVKKLEDNKKEYTLTSWYNAWLEFYKINGSKEIRETTITDYKKLLKHFGDYAELPINKFNNITIIKLLNDIPYPRTRQKMFEVLKQVFNKAKINQLIKIDPMQDLEKPRCKQEEKPILTEHEEKLFIEECKKEKYGDYFLICLYQGLRRGECLALTRNDIDFDNKILDINKSINAGTTNIETKNSYSNRKIAIFDNTLKILEKYKDYEPTTRLFDISIKNIDKHFQKIKNKLNLKITIHSLRHNFITKCVELGIPEHIIQYLVGHAKDSKITKKVYTHIRTEAVKSAIDIINNNINN